MCQVLGYLLLICLIFARFGSIDFLNTVYTNGSDESIDTKGKSINNSWWPVSLSALFNGFAPYLFLVSQIMIFLPPFVGKLSIIRDIYSATIFKPLGRITYSVSAIQGLVLFHIAFSNDQLIYFNHQNMYILYLALLVMTYILGFFIALFFEYPFRTLSKVYFCPPQRVFRLKGDLAKELDTGLDNLFSDISEDELGEDELI